MFLLIMLLLLLLLFYCSCLCSAFYWDSSVSQHYPMKVLQEQLLQAQLTCKIKDNKMKIWLFKIIMKIKNQMNSYNNSNKINQDYLKAKKEMDNKVHHHNSLVSHNKEINQKQLQPLQLLLQPLLEMLLIINRSK